MKEREERQAGDRIGKKVEVITKVPFFAGRIPADIAVGLREITEAIAIEIAVFPAVTGMVGAKACSGDNRRAVSGNVKPVGMNPAGTNRFVQEAGTEDLKQGTVSLIIDMKGSRRQASNELSNGFFFYGVSLLALGFGLLHPFDKRGLQMA